MTTTTPSSSPSSSSSPYRSTLPENGGERGGRGGFAHLAHAEWTKFRTVTGWAVGVLVAIVLMVLMSASAAKGNTGGNCVNGKCQNGPSNPTGPGGEPVADSFYFVHRTLDGDGSITVRISSLTDSLSDNHPDEPAPAPGDAETWGKAGIIVKSSETPGSAYAAVLATSGHGVRMQYDYVNDVAGDPADVTPADPRWLRLTRTGDVLTGYDSVDGVRWDRIGTAKLTGLSTSVQAGLFATSPQYSQNTQLLGGISSRSYASTATGSFDHLTLQGNWPDATWSSQALGDGGGGQYAVNGGTYTVSGSGDIAPGTGLKDTAQLGVAGVLLGLMVLIVLASQFITSEYRRGLIGTTLAAHPRRGAVLAAKALVIATVATFSGLLAAAVSVPVFDRLWPKGALYIVSPLTEARVICGSALLLAVTGVFALAVGTIVRRSAIAITSVIVLMILPYLLATGSLLPDGAAEWLLRVTPAAGFAIEQTIPHYFQVDDLYQPAEGYFPLAPWAGFAVLCGYAAVALALAWHKLRGRDVSA
jgi:ABC-type transport system involved in multi-copper enzyme maturation permease subunit